MVRSSKLIMAAMRSRSLLLKILRGVRFNTSINSGKVLGVYLAGVVDFLARYFSSFGSINLTNFCSNLLNML